MHRKISLITVFISFIASEIFFYSYLSSNINQNWESQLLYYITLFLFLITFGKSLLSKREEPLKMKSYIGNFILGFAFTLLVTKFTFVLVAILAIGVNAMLELNLDVKFIALIVATIPFVSFVYGITKGKYNYKVIRVPIEFLDLPKEFDGYKIVQISDVHAGGLDSKKQVQKGIDIINKQNADLVLFTGDLVNNYSAEIKPFISIFKNIKAKDGKYSILGNHDYGDYVRWKDRELKSINFQNLIQYQKDMGFKLLMNEHVKIKKQRQEIALVGVENWGVAPFPEHGDLDKATEGLNPDLFTLLMSHDPSHWDSEVIKHRLKFNLTMSGHTHGMQFGLDIKNIIKWSPIKYKYAKWSGLYERDNQYLYVNKGFGFLGFPGRVGMWPEITVFELKVKKSK